MDSTSKLRTAGRAALVAVAALTLAVGAFTFAQSDQASRVAEDAIVHARLQEAAASAAGARADVVISLAAESTGVRDAALEDAALRMSSLTTLDVSPALTDQIDAITARFEEFSTALESLGSEEVDPWGTALIDDLGLLTDSLIAEAQSLEAAIRAESSAAGDTARAASVVVALIAPALAVFVLHRANRARVDRLRLTAAVERERAISAVQTHLISGLSHELRTPLTGISGFAEALVEIGGDDPDFAEEAGRVIYTESNELQRMIEDMLVMSRVSQGSLAYSNRPVDATSVIAAAVEPFLKSDHELTVDAEAAVWNADRLRVRHILRNLVSNALKHGQPPVSIEGRISGDRYLVSVIDHGRGFDEDDLDRVRSGFVHADDSATTEGSVGLGFSVASAIAEGMQSSVDVARTDDTTRISLSIPLAPHTTPARAEAR
jgi:signal transduction histidine kinase